MQANARQRNMPPHPLHPGHTERHEAMEIRPDTRSQARNSILAPGVSMAAEVAAINQGFGERLPNNRYRYNGRTWIDKGTGETFPESGNGIWTLSGSQFTLLKRMIRDGGSTEAVDTMVANNPYLNDGLADEVEALFDLIKAELQRSAQSEG